MESRRPEDGVTALDAAAFQRWRWPALLPALLTLLTAVVASRLIEGSSSVPYNVREVIAAFPTGASLAVCLGLLSVGMIPEWLLGYASRPARLYATLFVSASVAGATLLFIGLRLVVPLESIDDIVGFPHLVAAPDLERWLRFVGLFIGPLAGLAVGLQCARTNRLDARARVAIVSVPLMVVAWLTVVTFANTSNVVELLRGRGSAVAAACLAAYLVMLGAVSRLQASVMIERRRRRLLVAAAALTLALPIGWLLMTGATNPRLAKYGTTFSAMQFLLSPDRDHYVGPGQVALRFAAAQVLAIWFIAAGAAAAAAMSGSAERGWSGGAASDTR